MLSVNLTKWIFAFNSASVAFVALLVNCFERRLPTLLPKVFRHGKFSSNAKVPAIEKLEVPKSWFRHFYTFSGPLSIIALLLLFHRYYLNDNLPNVLVLILNFSLGDPLQALIPPENAILAMVLFTIHCWKRFFETHYVSVYSNVTMNISVYFIGLYHYLGTTLSILGETSDFTTDKKITLDWTKLTWLDYIYAILFLMSTFMQLRTNLILANLRKDAKGTVVTQKYKVPHGELFEYVSAPLQLTEICLYLSLSIILRNAVTFHFVTVWVIINQLECAYLSHQWSLKSFKNYPKSRKIIIPYIL